MRLVCPNCDAEYEVDDAAIPRDGRDVQCSSCGHAWFQVHPEVEAEQDAEADLYDAPTGALAAAPDVEDEVAAGTVAAPVIEPGPVIEPEPEPEVPVMAPPKARTLDETVLAVLREEAEREAASRRAETAPRPALESQTEMPLAAASDPGGMAAAVRRIARMRGVAAEPAVVVEAEAVPEVAAVPRSRGKMFPAIEDINSTLRATGDRDKGADDAMSDALPDLRNKRRSGFRRGFVLLVVVAVTLVALYVLAPLIAARVPALAAAASAYVAAVDAARVWLDANLRALVAMLRGLAGDQGG